MSTHERPMRRRASDATKPRRRWQGGVLFVVAVLVLLVALYRDNDIMVLGAFMAAAVSGNVIPFVDVQGFVLRILGKQ